MNPEVTLEEVNLEQQEAPDAKPAGDAEAKPAAEEKPPAADAKPATLDGDAALAKLLGNPAIQSLLDLKLEGDITPEQIAALPAEAKMALAAVVRQVTDTKSALDTRQQQAKAAERAAQQQAQRALTERKQIGAMSGGANAKAYREYLEKEAKGDGLPVVPGSEEAIRREIAQQNLAYMTKFFEALEKDSAAAQAQLDQSAQVAAIEAFMEQHPDDFEEDAQGYDASGKPAKFVDVIRTFTKAGMPIDHAWATADALRAKHTPKAPPTPENTPVGKGGPPLGRAVLPPPDLEGEALGQWWADHPEAAKAFVAQQAAR